MMSDPFSTQRCDVCGRKNPEHDCEFSRRQGWAEAMAFAGAWLPAFVAIGEWFQWANADRRLREFSGCTREEWDAMDHNDPMCCVHGIYDREYCKYCANYVSADFRVDPDFLSDPDE